MNSLSAGSLLQFNDATGRRDRPVRGILSQDGSKRYCCKAESSVLFAPAIQRFQCCR